MPAGASFPMRSSASAGGAGISARTLGIARATVPVSTAWGAKRPCDGRQDGGATILRRRGLGMPEGRSGRKLAFIIEPEVAFYARLSSSQETLFI